jgi:ABC-type multidrug transport system ATPase subunit
LNVKIEADALSDRIAIMSRGEIKCCGSPHFLKNEFGLGYRIRLTKGVRFDGKHLMSLIENYNTVAKNFVENDATANEDKRVQVEMDVAGEICLAVSNKNASLLPKLLSDIEQSKRMIDIDGYSISSSTVEEVFLRIEHSLESDKSAISVGEKSSLNSEGTGSLSSRDTNKSESILSLIDNNKKNRVNEYEHDLSNGNSDLFF